MPRPKLSAAAELVMCRPPIMGLRVVVASGNYLASLAGMRIIEQGGNAIDAGVAAGLCLNVLMPHMTSFGGVAPIIIYSARDRKVVTISGLGRWPRAASVRVLKERWGTLDKGIQCTVTPAAPDAWLTALEKYGTMSFSQVADPALELCERGFPVYTALAVMFTKGREILERFPSTMRAFYPGGKAPQVGEVLVQPDLAHTFKLMMAAEAVSSPGGRVAGLVAARDEFYRGSIATKIIEFMKKSGGLLELRDLEDFRVKLEEPVAVTYKGFDVWTCGSWCQGPVLAQTLAILEGFDLKEMGHNSTDYIHTVLEALKLSFADREAYYGDPEFVDVPIKGILDKSYAGEQRRRIDPGRAFPEIPEPGDPWKYEGRVGPRGFQAPVVPSSGKRPPDTSYVCVMDNEGNAFSATPSEPLQFGPIAEGLGFQVSTRGTQSWLDEKHPSSVQPWKRPRLTPSPAIVTKGGRLFMAFGTPGGDVQPQTMLQVFLNIVEFGMDPEQAVEAPRFATWSFPQSFSPHIYEPGKITVETRISEHVRRKLELRGHRIELWPDWEPESAGSACAITFNSETRVLTGGADPRRMSYAIGW